MKVITYYRVIYLGGVRQIVKRIPTYKPNIDQSPIVPVVTIFVTNVDDHEYSQTSKRQAKEEKKND